MPGADPAAESLTMHESIHTIVDGDPVEGRLRYLSMNDIRVEITFPFSGVSKVQHVPYFSLPYIRYAQDATLTPQGRKTAELLLREVYEACAFAEANEEALLQECQAFLGQGSWALLRSALARIEFAGNWHLLPVFVLLFVFTDWEVVSMCQDHIVERFGRKLPDELIRGLLALTRWLANQA
jgi:hypothetical protein